MKAKNITQWSIIAATVLLAGYFIYPSVDYYILKTPQQRLDVPHEQPSLMKKIFNLGLDLQGGMRLVMELDRSKVDPKDLKGKEDLLDIAYTVIENRINGLGVAEPIIQKQGTDRLIVELPGLKDEESAKNVIGKTALLEFKVLRDAGQLERAVTIIENTLKGTISPDSIKSDSTIDSTSEKTAANKELADKLFAGSEVKDTTTQVSVDTNTAVESDEAVTSFKGLLSQVGDMIGATRNNKPKIEQILGRKDVREALERAGLGGNQFLWSHDTSIYENISMYTLYYLKGSPEMTGSAIKDARPQIDQTGMRGGGTIVELELNPKGARKFSSVTGANVNKMLAIVLDSVVYSAPRIIQKISGGRAEITGTFSMEEAKNLSIVLRAGALPVPVTIIEQRTVGPTLGQDSIKSGINAALIGFGLVFFFILFYYRLSGLYANIALFLNAFFVLAIMSAINQTLTLPGICGLVLNLGMAVDANVLLCERIREELALGKTVRSAIDTGYSRALIVILDANLTTLITAFILLWLGTGPIKGFAVTLIIGLILSMYTALYITRAMYDSFTTKNQTKLSI